MILVTGANGQLGSALMNIGGPDMVGWTRADLDLRDTLHIRESVTRLGPRAIINCAAYTDVDGAESDVETARAVNAIAVGELALAAADLEARFVTVSTDYVFDGAKSEPYVESDEPCPVNAYGRTKREGEERALTAHPTGLVVRSSWILSATHRNFLTTILGLMRAGEVGVVDDQRGRPTMSRDLASALVDIVEMPVAGVIHLTNQEAMTWYSLAREIAKFSGLPTERVTAVRTDPTKRPARRPANSCLDSDRLAASGVPELGSVFPSLRTDVLTAVRALDATASGQGA